MKLSNFATDYADILAGGPATGAVTYISSHEAGTASMHVASAVTITDAGNYYVGSTVEAALQELGTAAVPSLVVYDESSLIGTPTAMKFAGDGVTATYSGGTATVTVTVGTASTNIPIYDEGTLMGTATSGLNFTGSGVSGTVTSGTAVITISGGGTASSATMYLDTYSDPLDGTMGDHFTGTALDARWSRRNLLAANELYQQGGGSWLSVSITSGTAAQQYYQTCPAGDWEFIASFSSQGGLNQQRMHALGVVDSSGNGRAMCFYTDTYTYLGTIATYVYSTYTSLVGYSHIFMSGGKVWARIRKSGNTIYVSQSMDGANWTPEASVSDSSTWSEVFIGRVYGSQTDEKLNIDLFDRIA